MLFFSTLVFYLNSAYYGFHSTSLPGGTNLDCTFARSKLCFAFNLILKT